MGAQHTAAPANHVRTWDAQGWRREHCGEELPPSTADQGPTQEIQTAQGRGPGRGLRRVKARLPKDPGQVETRWD